MLQKEQLEKLLERCMASSCDFAEIFEEEGTTESLSMLNGKLEDTNVLIRAGIGIRLYKGVQSVYGYTNETSEESLNLNLYRSLWLKKLMKIFIQSKKILSKLH